MQYKVVEKSTTRELERAVRDSLRDGWSVAGGLCVTCKGVGGMYWYHQAMTKPDPVPKPLPYELVADSG